MCADREFNKMEMVSQRFSIGLISSISEHDAMHSKCAGKDELRYTKVRSLPVKVLNRRRRFVVEQPLASVNLLTRSTRKVTPKSRH